MKLVEKVLVVHHDPFLKRRLVLALADSSYDVRAFTTATEAVENARGEWFDLVLVDATLDSSHGFFVIGQLRQIQPTLPGILLVPEMELAVIVESIRRGITDVVEYSGDPRAVLESAQTLLRPAGSPISDLTPAALAEIEEGLANLEPASQALGESGAVSSRALVCGVKEFSAMENRLERVSLEKAALEAELKALLSQNADAARLQAELAELHSQRELAEAAQETIDAKARQLAEMRQELVRERHALEAERRARMSDPAATATEAERERLSERTEQLRAEEVRLQQEAAQIARERRRWHEDLDLLRAQEDNLRDYEGRLRQLQAQLEADRVLWLSGQTRPPVRAINEDANLKTAWEKLQRASELLEAERATFRDERMALREYDAALKKREVRLQQVAAQQAQEAGAETARKPAVEPARAELGVARSLTRAPFVLAKTIWSKG